MSVTDISSNNMKFHIDLVLDGALQDSVMRIFVNIKKKVIIKKLFT